MLAPEVYPLNWACWDGWVSRHWQEEEHPLDHTAVKNASQGAATPNKETQPEIAEKT